MRNITVLNDRWFFKKDSAHIPQELPSDWEVIDLPYTWNGQDGQDGGNDYFRGTCVYCKSILADCFSTGEQWYLQFEGVSSSCEVFWNGQSIATHDGGYSCFHVPIPETLSDNLLTVIVDNSPNDRVYPQRADFTFYGGIYRSVKLISLPKHHFELGVWGENALHANAQIIDKNGVVSFQAFCIGKVRFNIYDGESLVGSVQAEGINPSANISVPNVHLWDGTKDPYLYTTTAELLVDDTVVDIVTTRIGFRHIEIDATRGFYLNGRSYPLRGVSRHQDRPGIGNALQKKHHLEDIDLICEMGANAVRLAHYQHDQTFYDLCDERGLLVWTEIPYISEHMANGIENTKIQMTELVCQNWNHPSIVVWGLSNEIGMNGVDKGIIENHRMLHELVYKLDNSRQTVIACVTMTPIDSEYIHIPDLVGYNHYFGWYGGNYDMYGPWLDHFHSKCPDTPLCLSEYGCDALNWHSSVPEQGDYTEEYQALYHEALIRQLSSREYLWGSFVWNMFDFAADARADGGEAGVNHKGLVTFDRSYKKDAFFAYKAWLSTEPMIHLCGKRYVDRVEDITQVTIYSNQAEVELFANGVSVGKQKKGDFPFFYFEVVNRGSTTLLAKSGNLTDCGIIKKVDTPNLHYVMQGGSVLNWFEISTPAGCFSINDTIGSVLSTFKGKLMIIRLILSIKRTSSAKRHDELKKQKSKGLEVMGYQVDKNLFQMVKGMTVKRSLQMLGDRFSKDDILKINSRLNRIKKPRRNRL